jgi:N-terminal acetyltransferase B complex non-catalytic subunit
MFQHWYPIWSGKIDRIWQDPTKLPLRSIQTPQELLLLHRIASILGKPEQQLEYLRDPNLGPESVVAKGEWQLWRIKLGLLKDVQEWKELFDITGALLKRARTKDEAGQLSEASFSDWIVWDAFVRSATELREEK